MKKLLSFLIVLALALFALTAGACRQKPEQQPDQTTPAPVVVTTADPGTDEPQQNAQVGSVRVLFINVGRADAILIEAGGRCALIDTGEKEAVPQLFAALRYFDRSEPDIVFLTHTHSDHMGGMEWLCRNAAVSQAYAAAISENKKNGENKIAVLCEKVGVPLTRLTAGGTVTLTDGVTFEVLGPLVYNGSDDNDNSLVLRLTVNGRTILFTGDMQFAEEGTLLNAGTVLAADVLKVGNHGNPDATSEAFGAAVSPSIAVITTNKAEDANSANPRVIEALNGAAIYITQDYPLGLLLTIAPDGTMTLSAPETAASGATVELFVDTDDQIAEIRNTGAAPVDLSGFVLYSERGGECFRFPEGTVLAAGESLTVSGENGGGDFVFDGEKSPWNQKKQDQAILFDAGGHRAAES